MVRYFAKIAADKFTIDDVVQTIESNGDVRLLLTQRGESYSFTVPSNGSWLNVPGTLDGLIRYLIGLLCLSDLSNWTWAAKAPGLWLSFGQIFFCLLPANSASV